MLGNALLGIRIQGNFALFYVVKKTFTAINS